MTFLLKKRQSQSPNLLQIARGSKQTKQCWKRTQSRWAFQFPNSAQSYLTEWSWSRHGHVDQGNKTESPGTKPHIPGTLICNKGANTILWRNWGLFMKLLGRLGGHRMQNSTVGTWLHSRCSNELQWIRNFDTKSKTIKLFEESIV